MKKKICVIFGGESSEYEISLKSAYSVLTNLDKNIFEIITVGITKNGKWFLYDGDYEKIPDDQWHDDTLTPVTIVHGLKESALLAMNPDGTYEKLYFDAAFPVLHGKNGEDGTIQGLFELSGIRYVGVGTLASSVGMDKTFSKLVFENAKIPQANWVVIAKHQLEDLDKKIEEIEVKLGYPVFIKPANAGSSIGIGKAKSRDELICAINEALKHDRKVLIEEFLTGHEVECAVLGNRGKLKVSCVGEIVASQEFYTYDAKYNSDCPSTLYIPAKINDEFSEKVREYAALAFDALDAKGLSRVDFFVDETKNKVWLNEINTLPGFTNISMYPKLMQASGIKYADILTELIEIAFED